MDVQFHAFCAHFIKEKKRNVSIHTGEWRVHESLYKIYIFNKCLKTHQLSLARHFPAFIYSPRIERVQFPANHGKPMSLFPLDFSPGHNCTATKIQISVLDGQLPRMVKHKSASREGWSRAARSFHCLIPARLAFYEPLEGSAAQPRPKEGRKVLRDKSLAVIGRSEEDFCGRRVPARG